MTHRHIFLTSPVHAPPHINLCTYTHYPGRQYARKPTVYVDVLGLSTITEAVQAASDMLRRGILYAMACSIDEKPAPPSKADKIDRQKPQIIANGRPNSATTQQANGAAGRDPVSVYSAVTKRTRKNVQDVDPVRQNSADSPVQIVNEKLATDSGKSASKTWNSAKKAGPSILSKRNRAQIAAGGNTSGTERVFQPAAKREKRAETSADSPTSAVSQERVTKPAGSPVIPVAKSPNATAPAASLKLPPFVKTKPTKVSAAEKASESKDPLLIKSSQTVGSPPVPSEKDATSHAISIPSNPPSPSSGAETSKTTTQSSSTNLVSKPASEQDTETLQPLHKTQTSGVLRSPGASKLPSAWSQITGKSSKTTSIQPSGLQVKLLPQKPGSAALFPRATFALGSSARSVELGGTTTAQQLSMRRTRPQPNNRSEGVTQGSIEPIIPLPSSSGLQVKNVPGSEIVKGVRPNGYTVSRDGVVKPVVTFSPKPKLPHKLRQTSVEKLFEEYRDKKKLTEGDALARALRAEQEMYADAADSVDYRAAVTVKLKEIRK